MCVGNTEIKDEVLCAKPFSFNSCIGRYISSFHFTTVGREFMHRIYSLNYVNSTWFLTAPPPKKVCFSSWDKNIFDLCPQFLAQS